MIFSIKTKTIKRACLALLIVSLFSCSKTCPKWSCSETKGSCTAYDSTKLVFASENSFSGIELELIKTSSGTRIFLSVTSFTFTQEASHPSKSSVTITLPDKKTEVLADRLEGGQKLVLPEYAANEIISALIDGKPVILQSGRFRTVVEPDQFLKYYKKFLSN